MARRKRNGPGLITRVWRPRCSETAIPRGCGCASRLQTSICRAASRRTRATSGPRWVKPCPRVLASLPVRGRDPVRQRERSKRPGEQYFKVVPPGHHPHQEPHDASKHDGYRSDNGARDDCHQESQPAGRKPSPAHSCYWSSRNLKSVHARVDPNRQLVINPPSRVLPPKLMSLPDQAQRRLERHVSSLMPQRTQWATRPRARQRGGQAVADGSASRGKVQGLLIVAVLVTAGGIVLMFAGTKGTIGAGRGRKRSP